MFDIQVRLHENGNIEYIYRDQTETHSGPTASVGIMDHLHNYQSLPDVGANPMPSTTTFTTIISGKPANNQYYRWSVPQCTNPPTAGSVDILSNCFINGSTRNLNGNSIGLNQTYEWEYSANNSSFTSISTALSNPLYNWSNPTDGFVRCKIKCGNGTPVYTPAVSISIRNGLPGGNYTINAGQATTGSNFASFTEFANALACGITGPIVVDVVAGSGPYTERLELNDVLGTSATNTITINGNGNTLQFNSTSTSNMYLVKLNGTKYLKIDNLTIKSLNATYGYGILFTNGAAYDTITNCHIDLSTITGTSSANASGIAMTASLTATNSPGRNAKNIYIANNLIEADHPTQSGGGYYGITVYGVSNADYGTDSIFIINNEIKNFYYYGIYGYNSGDLYIDGNNVHRSTKTATTTNYGIYTAYTTGAITNNN